MFERCLYFNSNSLVRKLNRIWDEAYQETGLSAPHAYMLRMVAAEPGLTQKEIAEQLQLEKSTITRFANSLIEKGLIVKQVAEDGRKNSLAATKKGNKLADKLNLIGDNLYKQMQQKLGLQNIKQTLEQVKTTAKKLDIK